MSKIVAIIGIDSFLKKNYNQILCLNKNEIKVHILTNDTMKSSFKYIDKVNKLGNTTNHVFLLKNTFLSRIIQIIKYFKQNKKLLNHIEVYAGGRFSFLYVLIAKLYNIKIICIERGDLSNLDKYDKLTLFSMKIVYKYSDIIIYKELYMKLLLKNTIQTKRQLYFLYNCVSMPDIEKNIEANNKTIIFLWLNRLLKERKIEWVINAIKSEDITQRIAIVGALDIPDKYVKKNLKLLDNIKTLKNVSIAGYVEPIDYYKKSKFYILPSEIVFGNNALLEAMSYGLIPIVSNIKGTDLIIEDGIDGILFEHTERCFKDAIKRALSLSEEEVYSMSLAARKKVKNKFSCDKWCKRYLSIINEKI